VLERSRGGHDSASRGVSDPKTMVWQMRSKSS
jgi:hypothetical protein